MPVEKWPVNKAVEFLEKELRGALEFKRAAFNERRTEKGFVYETPGGFQFGVILGDALEDDTFAALQTQVVLERAYCVELPSHPGLEFRPPTRQSGRDFLKDEDSRLKSPGQQLVMVGSPEALRCLVEWYCGVNASSARSQSTQSFPSHSVNLPLNTILYGPPGTGKTYATIEHALEILHPTLLAENKPNSKDDVPARRAKRKKLQDRFQELLKDERIRFVTFHQSFSYEDFVEGIRAVPGEVGEPLRYDVVPGILKQICIDAQRDPAVEAELGIPKTARVWKMSIDGTGDSAVREYCLNHDEARIGWGHVGDLTTADLQDPKFDLSDKNQATLSHFVGLKPGDVLLCIGSATTVQAVGIVQEGGYRYDDEPPQQVHDHYKNVQPVRWIARELDFDIQALNDNKRFTQQTLYPIDRIAWPLLAKALEEIGVRLNRGSVPARQNLPYVLIIDEINRGNVSRIFGELITLVEESKRIGASEELKITLPYSPAERFGVPKNVYLLGTMNTADRSLAGLDIALRRRFVFQEMPPRPELLKGFDVGGVDVGELLQVMNERIEVLLDREHRLGHAYFMPLLDAEEKQRLATLAEIFRRQVLPLLEEYFFEDWERIRWVLNDHRKRDVKHQFVRRPEKDLGALFGQVAEQLQDRRWALNPAAFAAADSYRLIIQGDA